jgi:hypothetical protein
VVSSDSGTPLGVGTSHGHFGPQDTPRPGLRGNHHLPPYSILCNFGPQDTPRPGLKGNHHLPPYSILCNAPLRLHPNGSFSRDSQVGVPKLSRRCPDWSPGTLATHNARVPSLIATRSKPKL